MDNNETPKLSLRVFRRSSKHLVLLWRKSEGVDLLKTKLSFRNLKAGIPPIYLEPGDYILNEDTETAKDLEAQAGLQNVHVSSDTVICLVKEQEVSLDPSQAYYVKVEYGEGAESIKLMPAGVLPAHEAEDKKKNVHMMGWLDEKGDWRKLSAVKCKGNFFLGTVLVDPDTGEPLDISKLGFGG